MTGVLIKKRKLEHSDRHAPKEDHMKIHREKDGHMTVVIYIQVKEYQDSWKTPEARGCKEGVSPESSERAWPCRLLAFRFLASRTVRLQISIVLSHLVFGTLLR